MSTTDQHQLPLADDDLKIHHGCPACDCRDTQMVSELTYGDRVLQHYICQSCGLVFMNPCPRQSWYDRLYGQEFWDLKAQPGENKIGHSPRYWTKVLKNADKYIAFLKRHADTAQIRRVLEIGAAYGLIGRSIADRLGAEVFSVEPNDTARAFAVEHMGASVVATSMAGVASWKPDTPMDLVIFSHVLENITDLNATLSEVARVVRPGGYLFIETPNVEVQRSMSLYHPYCFSISSLETLLAEHGFKLRAAAARGRPTSILRRRYASVLAVNEGAGLPTNEKAVPRPSPPRLQTKARAAAQRFPLKQFDSIGTQFAYPLSKESRRLLKIATAASG